MANIYTNILNGTMDAYGSIISNNLNITIQRLTLITIVLTVPMVVASFYGMNVNMPIQDKWYAFPIILILSIVLSLAVIFLLSPQTSLLGRGRRCRPILEKAYILFLSTFTIFNS